MLSQKSQGHQNTHRIFYVYEFHKQAKQCIVTGVRTVVIFRQ